MSNTAITGLECQLGLNTGTWAAPIWSILTNVKDLTNPLNHAEIDTSSRASGGYRTSIPGFKEGEISWAMNYINGDTDFAAIQSAWENKTTVELFAANGVIATVGTEGFHSDCFIIGFELSQPLEGPVEVAVTAKAAITENVPEWLVISV
jgi:hypothetical protein